MTTDTDAIERPAAALATTEPTQGTLKATALASFAPIEAHLTTLAAGYFARVATLRDMGGLLRATTTTTKENN